VREQAVASLADIIQQCHEAGIVVPAVEHYLPAPSDDLCAELAWAAHHVAVLAGDQAAFAARWRDAGWRIVTPEEIRERGFAWFAAFFNSN
jgi:hypothetical protein